MSLVLICLPAYPSINLSAYLSVCLCAFGLSVCLPFIICLSVYWSVYASVCLPAYLSVCLSVCVPVCTCMARLTEPGYSMACASPSTTPFTMTSAAKDVFTAQYVPKYDALGQTK